MRAWSGRRIIAGAAALAALVPATLGGQAAGQVPAPTKPEGKVVRIPFPRDDGSLTPYSFQLGYPLMNLVYDTLLWRDTAGVPRPWLASALETSPDATRFTLRLTPGALWHDGRPLTSEDVRFTFRYVADHPSSRFTAEVAEVANVTTPDAATVVITTRRPSPGFVDQTLSDLPIMPAHLWQDLPAGQATPPGLPVGSGPYRLVERLEGGGYRFEANAGYWKGAPVVDQVVVPIISDLAKTLNALSGNNVDMVPLRLPPPEVAAVDDTAARVSRGPSYWGVQLVFNMRRAPFSDTKLRQAAAKAIDLERMARAVEDVTTADQGMVHPESPWAAGTPLKVTDEAGAKAALAGLAGQPLEVLSADNDPVHRETARQVAAAFQRAGLQAAAKDLPVAEMNKALGADGATPSFTLAVTSLGPASSYDPDFLARIFGSATATTSGYSSQAFDQVARRVATTVDPAARRAATLEELKLLATDLPSLPLLFPNGAFVYRRASYEGWKYVKGIGVLDKQSFLTVPGEQAAATTTTAGRPGRPAPDVTPEATASEGELPLGLIAGGLGLAAAALVGLALFRRRG